MIQKCEAARVANLVAKCPLKCHRTSKKGIIHLDAFQQEKIWFIFWGEIRDRMNIIKTRFILVLKLQMFDLNFYLVKVNLEF